MTPEASDVAMIIFACCAGFVFVCLGLLLLADAAQLLGWV
jgi:hypothetical protein